MGKKIMKKSILVGSAFETSLRIIVLLNEIKTHPLSEQQISCIDFLSIYGADYDLLDENLHGYGIFRFSEYSAKRELIAISLKKLVLRRLVNFIKTKSGYLYSLTNEGENVAKRIRDSYSDEYRLAVGVVFNTFPDLNSYLMQKIIFEKSVKSLEVYDE